MRFIQCESRCAIGNQRANSGALLAAAGTLREYPMSTAGSFSRFARGLRLNIAENLAAALDFDLAIADRPRDPASRLDQQPVVDDEVALETAADLSLVDGGGTLEQASLRNLNDAAVGQFDVDATFDEQLVAGSDFAGQGDPPANVETAGAVIWFWGIGEIGEPTQGLAGARRDCLRPSCTNGLGQKASFFGRIWHLRILSLHLPQTMGLRTRAAWTAKFIPQTRLPISGQPVAVFKIVHHKGRGGP